MPAVKSDREWLATELEEVAARDGKMLTPMANWHSLNYMRAEDGWGTYESGTPSATMAAVMAFGTGEVWAIDAYLQNAGLREGKRIQYPLEQMLYGGMKIYVEFLQRLGLKPPYCWIAGAQGLKGRSIEAPNYVLPVGPCVSDMVSATGEFLEGDTVQKALSPFFAKFYDAFGVKPLVRGKS
jgi:hypothetical protein